MEFNIVINQAALRPWVGKVNLKDAAIVGFIRALTPDDPAVRHYMLNGYYRLEAGWILRQVPLLDVSEDWLLRCLKKLKVLGLLDTFSTLGRKKRLKTYGRLSPAYFAAEQSARDSLDGRYAEKTPGIGENSDTRRKLPVSENDPGETPIDHKRDQCKADGTDPPDGVVAIHPEEVPRLSQEQLDELLAQTVPQWAELRAAQRKREAAVKQQDLPGLDRSGSDPSRGPGP